MKRVVSKFRAKRAKTLLRQGDKQNGTRVRLSLVSGPLSGLLLLVALWLIGVLLLHVWPSLQYSSLAVGQRAPETIVSTVDFQCQNVALTELSRTQAADAVPPVFSVDDVPCEAAVARIDELAATMTQVRRDAGPQPDHGRMRASFSDALDLLGVALTVDEALRLMPDARESDAAVLLKKQLRFVWDRGIVAQSERNNLFRGLRRRGRITLRGTAGPSLTLPVSQVATPQQALEKFQQGVLAEFPGEGPARETLQTLFLAWIRPNLSNLIYDSETTEQLRAEARAAVLPLTMTIHRGDTVVEKGQRITAQILEMIRGVERQTSRMLTTFDRIYNLIGNGGLFMVGLFVCTCLLWMLRPQIVHRNAMLALFFLICVLCLLISKGLLHLTYHLRWGAPAVVEFLLPLSLGPLLITVLVGSVSGFVVGMWLSFAIALLAGHSFAIFTTGLAAAVIAAYVARDVRRRLQVFRAGLVVGLAELTCALGIGALNQHAPTVLLLQALACLASGIFSAVLCLLLVPLFEALFKITTNITLLELSDLGHELLQRLAMEAPGTYHHSLVVANLTQAAAMEVGANPLLARVGAYFHDIGKLTKPEFFTENIQHTDSPHDDLSPSMSSLVIMSHVKEGLSLGLQHKLPRPILDLMREHHGTGLVSYFFHKAKQEQEKNGTEGKPPGSVDEAVFRYAGPKPCSKESAILSLADAVEAASRSLEKPTGARIEGLVDEVIAGKLRDDQLADSALTFSDLQRIRRSFIFSLSNMMHGRVPYPKDEDRDKQQASSAPAKPAGAQEAGRVSHGAGEPAHAR